jgi:hypothetical protein
MTLKHARTIAHTLDMTIRHLDGEYRVAPRVGARSCWVASYGVMTADRAEKLAYYTNDLDDAVATARQMAREWADALD